MGLTKINYNACNFNDGLPVTVRFADKVGDVLSMGSAKGAEKQPSSFMSDQSASSHTPLTIEVNQSRDKSHDRCASENQDGPAAR
jgi:hypothetical protein